MIMIMIIINLFAYPFISSQIFGKHSNPGKKNYECPIKILVVGIFLEFIN
jgi:hypothetical protein